jgi:hypothetical protein
MALELLITFHDPKRKPVFHPFSFQLILRRAWWPLAKQLDLPMLQRLETLDITQRSEAEQLVCELEIVRGALIHPEVLGILDEDAAYMLRRIGEIEPLIRAAIQDWDAVKNISL